MAKSAALPAPAPARLGDALAARLSQSPDPALRELAHDEAADLLPDPGQLLKRLAGDATDQEIALAMHTTSHMVINKLAGGR